VTILPLSKKSPYEGRSRQNGRKDFQLFLIPIEDSEHLEKFSLPIGQPEDFPKVTGISPPSVAAPELIKSVRGIVSP
jgi:hypothetical protein